MKKAIFLGLFSFAAAACTTFGQGTIALDNFYADISGPRQDVTLNGVPVNSSFTIGLFYVNTPGNYVADFASDVTGMADPTVLYSGPGTLTLGTGLGATGGIDNSDTLTPGEYAPSNAFNPGLGGGATMTLMLIAYDGSSYSSAILRGHSTAFTMTTAVGANSPQLSGDHETDGGIAMFIPEPSAFALAGLGAAAFVLYRRKKQA
jgi:hypothetical protein